MAVLCVITGHVIACRVPKVAHGDKPAMNYQQAPVLRNIFQFLFTLLQSDYVVMTLSEYFDSFLKCESCYRYKWEILQQCWVALTASRGLWLIGDISDNVVFRWLDLACTNERACKWVYSKQITAIFTNSVCGIRMFNCFSKHSCLPWKMKNCIIFFNREVEIGSVSTQSLVKKEKEIKSPL